MLPSAMPTTIKATTHTPEAGAQERSSSAGRVKTEPAENPVNTNQVNRCAQELCERKLPNPDKYKHCSPLCREIASLQDEVNKAGRYMPNDMADAMVAAQHEAAAAAVRCRTLLAASRRKRRSKA